VFALPKLAPETAERRQGCVAEARAPETAERRRGRLL
jgi:hypothetical protein